MSPPPTLSSLKLVILQYCTVVLILVIVVLVLDYCNNNSGTELKKSRVKQPIFVFSLFILVFY